MSDRPTPEPTDPPDDRSARWRALWDSPAPSGRGRPARVSRDDVVAAALALADASGLDAVSMRSVARRVGVAAMTLYSHVGSHGELIDAIVDRAFADFTAPDPGLPWRDGLERHARELSVLYRRHPWLLDLNMWRPPLAPHVFDVEEAGYRTLIDTGLSGTQVVEALEIVQNFVSGWARAAVAEQAEAAAGDVDYAAYWGGTTEFWERYFDSDRYPSMTRLWTTGAFESGDTPLEIPLNGLLDTLELVIARAQADGPAVIPTYEECLERYAERMDGYTEWSTGDVGVSGDATPPDPSVTAEDDQPR